MKISEDLKNKESGHVKKLTVPELKYLIRYQFRLDRYREKNSKKAGLVIAVTDSMDWGVSVAESSQTVNDDIYVLLSGDAYMKDSDSKNDDDIDIVCI